MSINSNYLPWPSIPILTAHIRVKIAYKEREIVKELQSRLSAVLMPLISVATEANALSTDDSTSTAIMATLEVDTWPKQKGVTSLWALEAPEPSVSLVSNSF